MILRDKIAHILIVDDDAISVMIAETLLQKHFHTHSVSNGHDALKAMDENHYDIVLMDINLGDEAMNGIQTMKLIRKNDLHLHTKIFAVTAYVDDKDWFLEQGFDDLYTKPIIKEEMVEVINQAFFRHPRRAA